MLTHIHQHTQAPNKHTHTHTHTLALSVPLTLPASDVRKVVLLAGCFPRFLFDQQSAMPALIPLTTPAPSTEITPGPHTHTHTHTHTRRWPLSLARHDSTSTTGHFVIDVPPLPKGRTPPPLDREIFGARERERE